MSAIAKLRSLFKESYDEMVHNVTWPTYKEVQQSSILVLIASLIFAVVIALMDFGFKNIVEFYYKAVFGA